MQLRFILSIPSSGRVDTAIWMHYMDANQTDEKKKAWQQRHTNAASNIEQVQEATPHKAAAVRPPTTHHENYQNNTNQTYGTLLEK